MKTICLKLASGEEVIGNFHNETAVNVELKDIASIVMMPGGRDGQVGLGLMPFLPYAESKTFSFNKSFIMVQFEPGIDMLNNYNRMFGSGIQIAKTV